MAESYRGEEQDPYQVTEEEFLEDVAQVLNEFVGSEETEQHLRPMNSFFRRLTHQLATDYGLETRSEGEDRDRHIVVTKTEQTSVPVSEESAFPMVWNFGDKEFFVDPMQRFVDVYLAKDGSIGLWDDSVTLPLLAKKRITKGSFKVKANQILEIDSPRW
ncbi:MAG: hypothetical protein A2600_03755 [Candidatus Lambdaproteobacteria bacterium RIFOXYD1_FULL_56_27]|uniref:R3H domain-containing protein n=1 Tax=Candidatus Lambdaproteobacteria bacterium RIFOXYD2_FULL_56_26 TaxID=1817773 RepID=A0A1F6H3B0_9PROT|nr:MAG: hypothetical protein A2426_11815 [Candidatus Lambdaproteobacteria bacterium RIFOXYC1_FULL_56_13]OGH04877.1 MAG: hypothetical protein A2557_07820 [Candidatus Lambdaproteobacteria bacterium RIFOXYD2_FULL_56_26]OGH09342.1 MAG: hypothetical protein A2600_03755 [Candidatus Lambdaproteobacteria bacterium RIFOXYD1_FULL_56_27]